MNFTLILKVEGEKRGLQREGKEIQFLTITTILYMWQFFENNLSKKEVELEDLDFPHVAFKFQGSRNGRLGCGDFRWTLALYKPAY